MQKKSEPRNRNEQEISGYRDVLSTIHESYDYISPASNIIQQLHRDLYSYNQNGFGGKYKSSDNIIAETDGKGIQKVRFAPEEADKTTVCAFFILTSARTGITFFLSLFYFPVFAIIICYAIR